MPHIDIPGSVSVTTVLKVLNKPYLNKWVAKHSLTKMMAYLEHAGEETGHPIGEEVLKKHGLKQEEFWQDAEALGKKAAERGTAGHAEVEEINVGFILGEEGDVKPKTQIQQAYYGFLFEEQFQVIHAEDPFVNKELGLHGTPDAIFLRDGKYFVPDYKFTNRLYPEIALQQAGYSLLETRFCDATGIAIRFGELKKTGWKMYEPIYYNLAAYQDDFLALLRIYKRFYANGQHGKL